VVQEPAPPPTVVHEETHIIAQPAPPPPQTTVVERDVVVSDPHLVWWHTYHPSEDYDRERALAAHRLWCDDHPADASCAGWYVRH
jgi:hypothetical protein